ncbi:hypothetical protein F0U61_16085 [Archangium violaceum]|uniref:hypothetical protein n=1 Tax=Archangium violaceum TaxID=83451 RepID=UPI002B2F161D|nr:hypothetical protein F0U61_16085 [Archangium violaceum]
MSQLRLSFGALVLVGSLFTAACGPQPEDAAMESNASTVQQQEGAEATPVAGVEETEERKKCDYKDPNLRYVSRDPATCAAILFVCEEGETTFFNECGCGCATTP